MFNFSSDELQRVLDSQTKVFNYLHGAGDSVYECKELTRGIFRERKARCESTTKIFVSNQPDNKLPDKQAITRRDFEKLFQSYRLDNTTGPQWTRWRSPKVLTNKVAVVPLPPSPEVACTELMVDIHEEKMECICYDLEEAPLLMLS